jgi:hypothetical protein
MTGTAPPRECCRTQHAARFKCAGADQQRCCGRPEANAWSLFAGFTSWGAALPCALLGKDTAALQPALEGLLAKHGLDGDSRFSMYSSDTACLTGEILSTFVINVRPPRARARAPLTCPA